MIVIHQAIYGDKAKGHSLLASSFVDDSIPKRLGNSTDVLDRPPNEILLKPIIRGFPLEGYFLIVKSFAHPPGEGIREGRVFSHALFIEKKDLLSISDLQPLFSYLIQEPVIPESLNPINHDEKVAQPIISIPAKGRAAFGVKGLVNHANYSNTIAWVGGEGYLEFMSKVWSGLPKHLRKELSFGAAFDPRKSKENHLKVVSIPVELVTNWRKHPFYLIELGSEAELTRMSEFYVAGDRTRAAALADLIESFRLEYTQISDLAILENVAYTYQKLNSGAEFNDIVLLADIISKFNPDPKSRLEKKSKILSMIASRAKVGEGNQILAMRGAHWKGFYDHEKILAESIREWAKGVPENESHDKFVPKVLGIALGKSGKPKWWSRSVQEGIIAGFKNWGSSFAIVLWRWINADSSLVSFLDMIAGSGIPKETDLVKHLPSLDERALRDVITLCANHEWYQLHAACLSQMFSAEEAIQAQLKIDIDPNHEEGLRTISRKINKAEFVLAAVNIGESRSLNIASEIVSHDRSIMSKLDVENENWRTIWMQSISDISDVWAGIAKPKDRLFELLKTLLHGQTVETELLMQIGRSEVCDLTDFPSRSDIWPLIPRTARSLFLAPTSMHCILHFDSGLYALDELEKPLLAEISQELTFRNIATNKNISTATKIALFDTISSLSYLQLIAVLENNRLDKIESKETGMLVLRKGWENAARFLYRNTGRRSDFKIALGQCYSILNLWERLDINFWGHAKDAISKSEWYEAFAECCAEILSKGPSQNGIWETCGGENADLLTSATGRDTWIHAINQLRNGSAGVKLKRLLKELAKEFPNNPKLKMLEGTIP